MTNLPVIVLNQVNENPNLFSGLFGDWRLYFGLILNGFFTGFGVYLANRGWENKIGEILKRLKPKEEK